MGDRVPTFNWVFKDQIKSLQKGKKEFASRQIRFLPLEPGNCLDYTSKLPLKILLYIFSRKLDIIRNEI